MEGERVVPSGFSALKPSDLGLRPTLSSLPLGRLPNEFTLSGFPGWMEEVSCSLAGRDIHCFFSVPFHLRSPSLLAHATAARQGGPWARCVDWEGLFRALA